MGASAQHEVERRVEVAAPAEAVWELISDLPGMGRFSPENTGGTWATGDGPAVGAVFRGRNSHGWRRWSTRVEVIESESPSAFAFHVSSLGKPVADWTYRLAPTASGCTVTEVWADRRGVMLTRLGALFTGVQDRRAYAAKSMEHTLQAVKAAAESDVHA